MRNSDTDTKSKVTAPSRPRDVNSLNILIAEQQKHLSARLKLVALYLVEHPQQVAFNTLAQIAEKAGVHPSTLVRFANHFGFSGFSELQKLYKNHMLEHPSNYRERIRRLKKHSTQELNNSPIALLREFAEGNELALGLLEQQTHPEILSAAIASLTEAETIYICGARRMYPVAAYLHYTLSQMEVYCRMIDDLGGMAKEQMKWMNPKSALIAATFSPYAAITAEVVQYAHQQKTKVILLTDSELSPLAPLATHLFIIREAEVRGFRSLNSVLCLAQTLCVALGYQR